ncbi:hypothetical protein N9E25_07780 [Verrucomicrobiales bacterium]|nr:hypothetical protein [Verrucomicrobiales bacterium]
MKWSPFTMVAAESHDGTSWKPVNVPDLPLGGEKLAPNHLFTADCSGGGVYIDEEETDGYRYRNFGRQHAHAVFEPALKDPSHHWHKVASEEGEKHYFGEHLFFDRIERILPDEWFLLLFGIVLLTLIFFFLRFVFLPNFILDDRRMVIRKFFRAQRFRYDDID